MNKFIVIKIILICLIFCLFNACIEPFTPDIGTGGDYLVINGTVTNEEGYHYVEISRTTSYSEREYLPVNDCEVTVVDGVGNRFSMENYSDGQYRAWIDEQYLQTGNIFKLQVINDGKTYESEYDSLLPCPDIDKIYFEEVSIEPDDPTQSSSTGIQFYLDYDATGDFADNYRWEFTETWEYRAEERTFIIYNGIEFHVDEYRLNLKFLNINFEEDRRIMDSLYTCWRTEKVNGIFSYTSRNKSDKKVIKLPVNIVTNKGNRLTIKYSTLVKQFAMSDLAFEYWNQLQLQSQEAGGLYETQPYSLKGNITCIDDEEEDVIGLFSTSSVKSKRFTTTIRMNRGTYYCADIVEGWDRLQTYLWAGATPTSPPPPGEPLPPTPLYLHPFFDDEGSVRVDTFSLIDQSCIDCRLRGGTIQKPDFW